MKVYEAYCSMCDARVRVTMDPEADHPIDSAHVECLDEEPSCAMIRCPLTGVTSRQLFDRLEFLPPGTLENGEPATRGWREAESIVRSARRAAMRRGHDPSE